MKKPLAATNTLKRFFELFTSDLSLNEIERLIKRDAPGVYDFYVRDMERPDHRSNALVRGITFTRNLFEAFLLKLTPARRILYAMALLIFLLAFLNGNWLWAGLAFLMLNILLAFELADKLTAKDELEVAREIQMNLMPRKAPANPCFEIACFSEAAREVGGDYYDFIQPDQQKGTTYVMIGDISGKGMAAALHMVQVQTMLHHLSERYASPRDVLIVLNDNLSRILSPNFYLTMSMASLNNSHTLGFCRAGHMPLLHYCQAEQKCREIVPSGIGVGMPDKGTFAEKLEEITITVEPGDILVFYTDGVVETMDFHSNEFGEVRLKQVIQGHADQSAQQIQTAILTALAHFRGTAAPHDDLTLVVMKAVKA